MRAHSEFSGEGTVELVSALFALLALATGVAEGIRASVGGPKEQTFTLSIVGTSDRLTAITTGNAKFRLRRYDLSTSAMLYDSGLLQGGQSVTFPWPAQNAKATLQAVSGVGLASSVSGELVRAD